MIDNNKLKTTVLPEFNCNNCESFISYDKEIYKTSSLGQYAVECRNVVHPIEDCILNGFKCHSEQPGFTQTLNK